MQTMEMERQKTEAGNGSSPRLEITRVIRASRERVFAAWTRPETVRQWFAPGNMIVAAASLDARIGGAYAIQMQGSIAACEGNAEDGAQDMSHTARVRGEYLQVVPNERLQFTWSGDWDPTEISLVTVSLRDVEGGTELTLTHEQFATELSRDKHQHGWTACLVKLVQTTES